MQDAAGSSLRKHERVGKMIKICHHMFPTQFSLHEINWITEISKGNRQIMKAIASINGVSSELLVLEFIVAHHSSCRDGDGQDGHSRRSLTWTQRITAAIGVAKGIQFLHTGIVPGIFSSSIKITDVLLDHSFVAKISSYNLHLLSNIGKAGNVSCSIGSKSSGADKSAKHDEAKCDIYDFGAILLELILGRTIKSKNDIDAFRELLQASVAADEEARRSIINPKVRKICLDQSLKTMMEICIRCLVKDPAERPSIEDVLWNLQFASQVQDAWRGDSQSSEGSPGSPLVPRGLTFH